MTPINNKPINLLVTELHEKDSTLTYSPTTVVSTTPKDKGMLMSELIALEEEYEKVFSLMTELATTYKVLLNQDIPLDDLTNNAFVKLDHATCEAVVDFKNKLQQTQNPPTEKWVSLVQQFISDLQKNQAYVTYLEKEAKESQRRSAVVCNNVASIKYVPVSINSNAFDRGMAPKNAIYALNSASMFSDAKIANNEQKRPLDNITQQQQQQSAKKYVKMSDIWPWLDNKNNQAKNQQTDTLLDNKKLLL